MNYHTSRPLKPNPRITINFISKLLFTYTRHTLIKGIRKELTEDDIYEVLPTCKSKKLGDKMEKEWDALVWNKKPNIKSLLFKVHGKEFLLITFSLVIPIITRFLQQKAIKQFVFYFTKQGENMTKTDAYFYGLSVVLSFFINGVYFENYLLQVETFTTKMRSGFISLIYRRVLKLDTFRLSNISVGNIINLITRDVNEFEYSVLNVFTIVKDILEFSIVCYLLYTEIGWLFLIFVLLFFLIMLPDVSSAYCIKSMKLKTLKCSDQRYQHTKEVLNSIRLIKLNLWTDKYNEKIDQIRKKEVYSCVRIIFCMYLKRIFAEFLFKAVWYILVVFSIYSGSQLNAGTLFLIMNSINILYRAIKVTVPIIAQEVASLVAVFERIGTFLRTTDITFCQSQRETTIISEKIKTLINDFKFTKDITVLTGSIGSGKSNFLKMMAKKLVSEKHRVSYASQEPWLFPSTIKQNIIFGAQYDEKRYFEVLRVCALTYDLESLKDGDKTIVADRGVNLSKGQQVRINLARAVYQNCDIYLLDDCLSSLDVLVANFIFIECLQTFLKNKTVIIVSQNTKYINASNNVVSLNDSELQHNIETFETEVLKKEVVKTKERLKSKEFGDEKTSLISVKNEKKIYIEPKTFGKVKFSTYKQYVLFGGLCLFLFILFLQAPVQILKSIVNKFESKWINAEQLIFNNLTNNEVAFKTRQTMIYLIPTLLISAVLLHLLLSKLFWIFAAKASINLHRKLMTRVSNATMEYFDKYLIGTILNRFSEDLLLIDDNIPSQILFLMNCFVEMVAVIFVIATVKAVFLVPCLLLSAFLLVARIYYLKSARALKRLEFTLRSPLLGHLAATLDGLLTITTSEKKETVLEEFNQRLDQHISCFYIFKSNEQAFYFFVDTCGVCFIAFIIVFLLVLHEGTSGGDAGLVLSQAIVFIMTLEIVYRWWTALETNMISVERSLEYMKQEQENKDGFLVENWPQNGKIKYDNISFLYSNDNYVYSNLNFTIESKEKVAVVGRTGSGKTSLIYTLMRLYQFQGKITIDDVDITTLPLDFYRSKISVILQDPILFSGSLRDNIDPTGVYTDDEIWTAIRTVKLNSVFESLDEKISGVDSNLSVGQKQLICLCRSLIRNNKIVIFDELTANVDDETETMMHDIIEEYFASSTVIMITHKLKYVLCYDKVLVLEKGRVVEFGSPSSLLEDKDGCFYKMYKNFESKE